jgi:hypothetical protein
MRDRKTTGILAGITISAAAVAWALLTEGFPPSIRPEPHRTIGVALAEEALRLLPPGGQLVVVSRDTTSFKQPAIDIALNSFLGTIKKSGVGVAEFHPIELDPLRPVQVPPGDFTDLIRRLPPTSVVVSFMGPPLIGDDQRAQIGEIKPKIVALCAGNLSGPAELRRLFDQGLLHAAVVGWYLLNPAAAAKVPGESFDAQYRTVTKANLGVIAPMAGSQP